MLAADVGTRAICATTLWLPSPQQPRVGGSAARVPVHINQGLVVHRSHATDESMLAYACTIAQSQLTASYDF